jgi:hypothetical protein
MEKELPLFLQLTRKVNDLRKEIIQGIKTSVYEHSVDKIVHIRRNQIYSYIHDQNRLIRMVTVDSFGQLFITVRDVPPTHLTLKAEEFSTEDLISIYAAIESF